jgi:hypothetical protein
VKRLITFGLVVITVFTLGLLSVKSATALTPTPSTNDANRINGWAYVDQLSQGIGTTDLKFTSTRGFWSCFEYRTDGDTSQIISENGGVNYNTNITDGLYPYYCERNSNETATIPASEYVEVRMVFGAETDERFDWTRFEVLRPEPTPNPDLCPNLEGVQYTIPTDYHLDAGKVNCVQFGVAGPEPQPPSVSTPQVLGATTTGTRQVLGASTMGKTGVSGENAMNLMFAFGMLLTTFGIRKFSSPKVK